MCGASRRRLSDAIFILLSPFALSAVHVAKTHSKGFGNVQCWLRERALAPTVIAAADDVPLTAEPVSDWLPWLR